MGVLDDGFASLAADLEEHAGEPVTYTRSSDGAEVLLTAVRERSTHERYAIADGRINVEEVPQDWCIRAAALTFGGVPHEPTRGDQITDAAGSVYEARPRSQEPAVRRSDPFGILWRVRTVLVTEAP